MYHKKRVLPKQISIKVINRFTLSNKVKEDKILKEEIVQHEHRFLEDLLDVIATYVNPTVFYLKIADLRKEKELKKYWRVPLK